MNKVLPFILIVLCINTAHADYGDRAIPESRQMQKPDEADVLNNSGLEYYNQGKYEQAEPLLLRGLELKEKAVGKDDPIIIVSLYNLAVLYKTQGKYEQAEPLYLRGLAIMEKVPDEDHLGVAAMLNRLAEFYIIQGKYEQAEPLYLRSLAILEKANHFDAKQTRENLEKLQAAKTK